jgi:C4-dicarboxylate transporter DctM subunit
MAAALIFPLLAVGLVSTLPMFIALAGVAFTVFALTSPMPLSLLSQRMFAGLDSFPLMAVPFFILAANIMGRGGLSRRLIRFVQTLVGHLPGGLAITAVLTCVVFGAITGSSASTIVAVGGILYPALRAAGYPERFALGVVTCSALLGMIIPPSNAMIVYGAVAGVSIGALFMAGLGAGLVFAVVYILYCYAYARLARLPRTPRATLRDLLEASRHVAWGLGMPAIILGGIYGGVFTATEAAAVSVIYAAVVCCLVYRELDLRGLWSVCLESGLATARILIMVAGASLFSWLLTVSGVTSQIVEPLARLGSSPWLLLLMSNVTLLVAGMFVDVFSNILILVPILLTTVTGAGIGGVHFGIITTVNADIGNITPPFGLNLFVASGAFDRPYTAVARACLPWLGLALLGLLIVTFVPGVSLWLPQRLYPGVR